MRNEPNGQRLRIFVGMATSLLILATAAVGYHIVVSGISSAEQQALDHVATDPVAALTEPVVVTLFGIVLTAALLVCLLLVVGYYQWRYAYFERLQLESTTQDEHE